MTLALGCIADDYTGASDLANMLTTSGLRTVQTIGVPADGLALPEIDVIVVSLKSRSIDPDEAVRLSTEAHRWLLSRGARHVLFKICSTFDSTERGNIGPVMEALRAESGDPIVLVTPAFPETGRTIYFGNLFVNGIPLDESPMKDHPLNPMRDANLMRLLAAQSRSKVGLVDLATVEQGVDAIRARLAQLAADGHTAAIIDSIFNRHLEPIGEIASTHRLSVGASGMGYGLAHALAGATRLKVAASIGAPVGGTAACLAGSCSAATLGQIAAAEKIMPVLRLDPERLVETSDDVASVLDWAGEKLAQGPVLIASSAPPDRVAAVQARFGREAAGHAIEQAMAEIAEGLLKRGVRRLIVAGGETSGAVVDRLAIPAFAVGPEIAPGVPVLRSIGTADGDRLFALKSGNFGGVDFFADALKLMS